MPALDPETIDGAVADLEWTREGDRLVKVVTKKDFREALAYVNAVGEKAEEANHHPDIAIHWNRVTLTLWTHTEGGITQADVDMARVLDGVE
jgi:4a-hydroxytetrahydrobiopterin dehydratase